MPARQQSPRCCIITLCLKDNTYSGHISNFFEIQKALRAGRAFTWWLKHFSNRNCSRSESSNCKDHSGSREERGKVRERIPQNCSTLIDRLFRMQVKFPFHKMVIHQKSINSILIQLALFIVIMVAPSKALESTITSSATEIQQVLRQMENPYAKYYPQDWPTNPFHQGEVKLQRQVGVHDRVMEYAPRIVRPYMPEQHRDFYVAQPFLVAAARDADGNMWSTLLMSKTGTATEDWITSPDAQTLVLRGLPGPHDALYGAFQTGSDVGLLGIEFATKRRNRVNGRITEATQGSLVFRMDQSFGNCPQYIKPRRWWTTTTTTTSTDTSDDNSITSSPLGPRPSKLSTDQIKTIQQAETIFTATGYRGEGHDVRFGNDASHRGGPKGFVMVQDESTLILPEFAGNNSFNTLGNLQMDNRMGITIPFFEKGGMLQLSGWAEVDMHSERASKIYPGALRITTFHVQQVNEVPFGSLPIRWSPVAEADQRQLQVTSIVQESHNVKSFHLQPLPQDVQSLWSFEAGQHLPIQLRTPRGELLRTYSLSGASSEPSEYRISVKLEAMGQASNFLHHHVKVGDIIDVNRPAGDFVLDKASKRTLVLISSGIGVTPVLSMLHSFLDGESGSSEAIWIHGARDGNHHPFQGEVQTLENSTTTKKLALHVRYSQPLPSDQGSFDSQGRIDSNLLHALVPNMAACDFYVCGNGSFMADVGSVLEDAKVDPRYIHMETF